MQDEHKIQLPTPGPALRIRPFSLYEDPASVLASEHTEDPLEACYLWLLQVTMGMLADEKDDIQDVLGHIPQAEMQNLDAEQAIALGELNQNRIMVARHALDLLIAGHSRKLRMKNVKSYYASADQELSSFAFVFSMAKWFGPKFVLHDTVRDYLSSSHKWTEYRVKKFAAASLALKLFDAYPEIAPRAFNMSRDDLVDIDDRAHDLRQSAHVPDSLKAVTYVYLESVGQLPDNWYQGEKAYDAADQRMLKKWRALFRFEKSQGTAALEELGDGATLRDAAEALGILM